MYCAYSHEAIVNLFEKYHAATEPRADALVDYFGAIVLPECAPYLAVKAGLKLNTPPFPDDTIRASFIEYLAVAESLQSSTSGVYQMCEIGASYAPFTAIAGLLALRSGATKIVLRPVEAAKRGIDSIIKNLDINGLYTNPIVDVVITNAAVTTRHRTLYFPDVDCTVDNGGGSAETSIDIDARGATHHHVAVEGIPLDQIIHSCDHDHAIDLIHVDIQGAENQVIPDSIGLLNVRVKRMLIATHSRAVEGNLLTILHRNGWTLIAEEPTVFKYRADLDDFTGMTTKDGSQYWVNRRLTDS